MKAKSQGTVITLKETHSGDSGSGVTDYVNNSPASIQVRACTLRPGEGKGQGMSVDVFMAKITAKIELYCRHILTQPNTGSLLQMREWRYQEMKYSPSHMPLRCQTRHLTSEILTSETVPIQLCFLS